MKQMDFQPQGTCSKLIHIELTDDDRVSDVSFVGGCPGNLKGISALILRVCTKMMLFHVFAA